VNADGTRIEPTPNYAGQVSFDVEVPDIEAALSARLSTTSPDRPAARSAARCPEASLSPPRAVVLSMPARAEGPSS
jgi:hypothetical protein